MLLLAEGVAAVGRPTGWLITLVLAGFLLYGEAAEILWYKAIQARSRPFDTHGDLKNDLLDYLEYHRWRALRLPPVEVKAPDGAIPAARMIRVVSEGVGPEGSPPDGSPGSGADSFGAREQ